MKAVYEAIERTIGKEGKYSDNPHDAGGKTMWGITEAVARKNGYAGDMRNLPRSTAVAIYANEYFIAPRFSDIVPLSSSIAEELFDTGVNMGVSIPGQFLQRALNVLNMSHKSTPLFADLVVDGKIGPLTIRALETFLKFRGKEGEVVMLTMLNSLQGVRYIELCERRVANEEFVYGWFKHRVQI